MEGDELRDPPGVVVAAYGLAVLCLLLPLAFLGALFAGVTLMRRGRGPEGLGVLVLGAVLTAVGITLLP